MLGLSRKEVDRAFDAIVDFSELGQFIDTQVKFYSSGMYVRLGFAIAVNVGPDVLVIDEVLAVGDEQFQAKCLERIRTFQEEGRTILFVSHNADQIRAICDRAVVLDGGRMLTDASPGEAVRVFREHLGEEPAHDDLAAPNRQLRAVRNVEILGVDVVGGARVHTGDPLHLRVGLRTKEPVAAGLVLEIHKLNGELLVRTDPDDARSRVEIPAGECVVTADVDSFDVLDGAYQLNVGIVGPHGTAIYDWKECAASIEVTYEGRASGTLAITPQVAVEPRPWY
jgi:ABC-2 type transport system ATP-binding protein